MKRLWTGVPATGERLTRALVCGAGAVLLVAASVPAARSGDGAVTSVSVEPTSGRAHVIIGVDGSVSVRDFVLHDPERIVVDITGATLGLRKGGYDRVARGGVLDVRYAQNQPNVVRVVLTLAGPKPYHVTQNKGEIRVSVEGGDGFTAWRAGRGPAVATQVRHAAAPASSMATSALVRARVSIDTPPPTVTSTVPLNTGAGLQPLQTTPPPLVGLQQPPAQQRPPQALQQPTITIAWEKADIRDVLATFAAYSGRTIIPARGVEATITAEIVNKPWDVAMKAILNANGFDAIEDVNGIIIVNTLEALAARPRLEQLTTRTIRFNYTSAAAVAAAIQGRLSRDCSTLQQQTTPGLSTPAPAAPGAAPQAGSTVVISGGQQGPVQCPVRGAVTADELGNSISITDIPSVMDDLIAYARSLDVRQPQVNIKAKIILIDRTQLEGLGLKYDLGSRNQRFNDIVTRFDSTGAAESGTVIFLGGNTLSGIANAAQNVPSAALKLIYSAALGAFDLTTFLDALQTVSLLDVQAEPSVTTLNLRSASLVAGTQVPVRTIEQGTGGNAAGGFPRVTVSMRQTGVVLNVTPQITNNRQIMMRVHAENSEAQLIGGDVGAVFPTQSLDNELLVADGETAVMGGLTQTTVRISKSGIPLLVDLPLIGRLFGVTTREETKRDLLILITPHIVDEGDMTMEPRRSP
jgi:type IV pilus assembly protein PilQ